MNDLTELWEKQKSFQKNFFNPENVTEEERVRLSKEYILSIHQELGEVLATMPWKQHRGNQKEYDKAHLQEELIDCFKFLLNLCILHGLTPDSFTKLFFEKSKIVEKRYADEMLDKPEQLTLQFPIDDENR